MKQNEKVNGTISIKRAVRKNRTAIYLYVNGERIRLCEMATSDFFWLKYVYDENYIVVYSRGCMVNQIPLKVEIAYDIKNNKIFNVSMKNEKLFEYMYIGKRGFDTGVVLQYLNDKDLQIASRDEVEDFERYITGGSPGISRESIVDYVIDQYPLLKEYVNITAPVSVNQYREIIEEMETGTLRFHIMPHLLNQE